MKFIFNFIEWVVCNLYHKKYGYDYIKTLNNRGCKIYCKCKQCGRIWEEPC